MKISYTMTENDVVTLLRLHHRTLPLLFGRSMFVIFLVFTIRPFWAHLSTDEPLAFLGFLTSITGLTLSTIVSLRPLYTYRLKKSTYKKDAYFGHVKTYELSEEGIKTITEIFQGFYKWSFCISMLTSPDGLLIKCLSGNIFIPRRAVSTEEEWNQLISLVKEKLPQPTKKPLRINKKLVVTFFFAVCVFFLFQWAIGWSVLRIFSITNPEAAQMLENGPQEAKQWIEGHQTSTPFMKKTFPNRKSATDFVDVLYEKGAQKVTVTKVAVGSAHNGQLTPFVLELTAQIPKSGQKPLLNYLNEKRMNYSFSLTPSNVSHSDKKILEEKVDIAIRL